jgi:hypothetical protein
VTGQLVVYLCSGLLLGRTKERFIYIYSNIQELHDHYSEQKKLDTQLGAVVHIYNLSTWEGEEGRSGVQG